MTVRLADLRRFAVSRSLFPLTSLEDALKTLGFLQADPIRAPARAQDLVLRHRVTGYRAGDLEHRYPGLDIEEDYFINYGFVTTSVHALMHPRAGMKPWPRARTKQAKAVLDFVGEQGVVHPREVNDHFLHGPVTNYWGGTSNATTHLLDSMHYRGLLRVAGRVNGIRTYAVQGSAPAKAGRSDRNTRIDALVDVLVGKYAPLTGAGLSTVVSRLRYCVPQWHDHLPSALRRSQQRLSKVNLDGIDWYWPSGEDPSLAASEDCVRFLAPFDPIVWDRRRFEVFWNWAYRFEAYTPLPQRKLGYYALPLLWRDRVVGWGNLSVQSGELRADIGYIESLPSRDRPFHTALNAELDRMRLFLGLTL